MKHIKRLGLGLAAFTVLFCMVSVAMPIKAGATDLPDFNSLGGGDQARDKVLAATTVTVINRARIDVVVGLDDSIYKSVSIGGTGGAITYREAFSGTYVDKDISDSQKQWELPRKVIHSWGETKLYASGYLYTGSDVPTPATSSADTTTWANEKVTLYLRLYLKETSNNPVVGDDYSFFIDVKDSGCDMGWHSHDCSYGFGGAFDSNDDVIGSDDYRGLVPKLANPEAIKITYAFKNNTIVSVDDRETYSLTNVGSGSIMRFFQPSSGGKVLFDTTWNTKTDDEVLALFNCEDCTSTIDVQYGDEDGSETVRVAQAESLAAETDSGEDGLGGISDADIDLNCDFSIFNPLSYFICPLVEMASSGINMLDSQINNQLAVPIGKDSAFDENNVKGGKSLYTAWASFRTIALTLLVIIALIMVISQAVSNGPFDSYTIKKVLPRIVVSVIFITLSWQLCKLLIGISNDFGKGVGSIIDSARGGLSNPTIGATGQSIGTVASIIGFFSGLDFLVVLSFMLTGLAAVLIAFLVVAFRNILIILLVITAPVALVLWILPNTQKAWGFWKSNFQAALLAFPIITAFIAIGRFFAILTSNLPAQNSSTLFRDVIVFFSYFGPYFALPAAFRLAGGAVASIGGVVNDRGKGFFDRNRKFRGDRRKETHGKRMEAKSWIGTGRTGEVYRRAGSLGRNGSLSVTRRGRARWAESQQRIVENAADEMLKAGGGRAFNDDEASELLRRSDMTRGRFVQEYTQMMVTQGRATGPGDTMLAERALARAEQSVGARVGSRAMVVSAQKFRTASTNTAYRAGVEGLQDLQNDLIDLQEQGLITAVDAAGWMKANQGRVDFRANGFVDTIRFASRENTAGDQLAGAFRGADPREIVGGHQRAVESFAQQAERNLAEAIASGSQEMINTALADVANIYDTLSTVSPRKAQQWADRIYSQPSGLHREVVRSVGGPIRGADGQITGEAGPHIIRETQELTYRELMDQARTNPTFLNRRREYSNAVTAQQAANGAAPPPEEPHP